MYVLHLTERVFRHLLFSFLPNYNYLQFKVQGSLEEVGCLEFRQNFNPFFN